MRELLGFGLVREGKKLEFLWRRRRSWRTESEEGIIDFFFRVNLSVTVAFSRCVNSAFLYMVSVVSISLWREMVRERHVLKL